MRAEEGDRATHAEERVREPGLPGDAQVVYINTGQDYMIAMPTGSEYAEQRIYARLSKGREVHANGVEPRFDQDRKCVSPLKGDHIKVFAIKGERSLVALRWTYLGDWDARMWEIRHRRVYRCMEVQHYHGSVEPLPPHPATPWMSRESLEERFPRFQGLADQLRVREVRMGYTVTRFWQSQRASDRSDLHKCDDPRALLAD